MDKGIFSSVVHAGQLPSAFLTYAIGVNKYESISACLVA